MIEEAIRAIVRDEIDKASPKTEHPRLMQGCSQTVAIPVGWRRSERTIFTEPHSWRPLISNGTCVGAIEPDPSIPWGEGYEAILPSEAVDGDGFLIGSSWIRAIRLPAWSERERNEQPWRRRIPATTPTEPARDLSAEVERLEADLETTKRLLAESLVERDRLKTQHDDRKSSIQTFRRLLGEALGDLR